MGKKKSKPLHIPKRIGKTKLKRSTRRNLEALAALALTPEVKALAGGFIADLAAQMMARRKRRRKEREAAA